MEALEEFNGVPRLVPSIPKSTAFFCNVSSHVKNSILQLMPFEESTLPIKYLGVPFISSRLLYKDCKLLVERVQNRIGDAKIKACRLRVDCNLLFLCSHLLFGVGFYITRWNHP